MKMVVFLVVGVILGFFIRSFIPLNNPIPKIIADEEHFLRLVAYAHCYESKEILNIDGVTDIQNIGFVNPSTSIENFLSSYVLVEIKNRRYRQSVREQLIELSRKCMLNSRMTFSSLDDFENWKKYEINEDFIGTSSYVLYKPNGKAEVTLFFNNL